MKAKILDLTPDFGNFLENSIFEIGEDSFTEERGRFPEPGFPLFYKINGQSNTPSYFLLDELCGPLYLTTPEDGDIGLYLLSTGISPDRLHSNLMLFPLISEKTITEFHDSVGEIINNDLIGKLRLLFIEYRKIKESYEKPVLNILFQEKLIAELLPKFNNVLSGAKSKLLRDFKVLFGSKDKEGWPFFNFLNASNIQSLESIVTERGRLAFDQGHENTRKTRSLQLSRSSDIYTSTDQLIQLLRDAIKSSTFCDNHYIINDFLKMMSYIYSIASYSKNYGYKRPKINNDGVVNIVDAHYPSYHFLSKYLPNDLVSLPINVSFNKGDLVIISGKQSEKKKECCQLFIIPSVLNQSGWYLPASGETSLPIFSKIDAQIKPYHINNNNQIEVFKERLDEFEHLYERLNQDTLAIFAYDLTILNGFQYRRDKYISMIKEMVRKDKGSVIISLNDAELIKILKKYPNVIHYHFTETNDGKPGYLVRKNKNQI